MTRYLFTIRTPRDRDNAIKAICAAPNGSRVEVKGEKRSLPQNDRMWAMLTDISRQLTWHGMRLTPDDWKLMMLDGLKRELRIVPNIDGTGFVNLGRSSSKLDKQEFTDLIELIAMFGAKHGVVFGDEARAA
jgi:hypothetical protein